MLHFTHYYAYIMVFMENLNANLNVFLVFHFHFLLIYLFIFIFTNKWKPLGPSSTMSSFILIIRYPFKIKLILPYRHFTNCLHYPMNDLFYEYMDNCMVLFSLIFHLIQISYMILFKKIRKIALYTKLINLNSIILKLTIIDIYFEMMKLMIFNGLCQNFMNYVSLF